ncbi:hypothetical protein Bpla01_55920 [Burkholderia plantarii]|nr:hypothetical protein Bpla01_55920 [Burkholderia plantarii]
MPIPAKIGGTVADVQLALVPPDDEALAHIEAFKLEQRYGWYAREIFDLMENYNRFKEYPLAVRKAVWPAELVLGFTPDTAPDRALGLCLLDVFRELESGRSSRGAAQSSRLQTPQWVGRGRLGRTSASSPGAARQSTARDGSQSLHSGHRATRR